MLVEIILIERNLDLDILHWIDESRRKAPEIRWRILWVSALLMHSSPIVPHLAHGAAEITNCTNLTVLKIADRVFVHALNTVKKIPKTGASRPPPADRLRLYGLYKQAMEGDVDGVMMRPSSRGEGEDAEGGLQGEELKRERDKWDAWDAQRGVSRTEAKRRYIEALIDTMHKYASTTA